MWAKGEIDNGGFALLYSGEVDITAVEKAFGSIGQPLLAQACAISRDVFDNREPPSNSSERRRVISTLHDLAVGKDPWAEANRLVWSVSEEFDNAVAQYIHEHALYQGLDSEGTPKV